MAMQVLLRKSDEREDIKCGVCGQGFRLYWERTSLEEQVIMREAVLEALSKQHGSDFTSEVHPTAPFTVPEWSGSPQFSGAAMLGGLSGFHRIADPKLDS
ncbi:hypothetical protein [Granulicella sp. dw_53]|uniref:hypothetical protein n=1 Tax=Granulicella sp. dw_53 TaxID=2719792 RepID=UPI001BD45BF0|nr:hypothetical protein [Granulicella sp. dw_53]